MEDRDWHVRICSEYFHPEEAATARLLTELATGLADDFEVSALTAPPSYHDGSDGSVPRSETHEGVAISRLRATSFDKDVLPLRVVNWITFTLLVAVRCCLRPADLNLIPSNPPVIPFATLVAKWLRGTPFVYVVHDVYPDTPVAVGLIEEDGLVARAWDRAMNVVYRHADRIVVLGRSMERNLRAKMADDPGFDPEKLVVIPNWEDGEFITPRSKADNQFARTNDTTDSFTLLYSGNVGRYHELETAIDAVALLEESESPDVQLLIIGDGARKTDLQALVERRGIDNVRFLPFQPRERLPETVTAGDAWLVGVDPAMEGACVSSKLYTGLAAGHPILAVVAEDDEVAAVVQEADCGAWVPPGDAERAAETLRRWAEDPDHAADLGTNARDEFERNYTRAAAVDAYAELLETVLSGSA